ncbi:hypothetical protein [Aedoeadaptatus coxii]|uniref:hypothetical protein n=1 Tax=Aedoeadaptatus coxii TaxID=755172 RepID=UPI001E597EAB|nr:hypothetical protein [Peptoniphilus coxii]
MKIEIQIDDTVEETVVKIMANRYSDEIEHIKNRLLEPHHHKLSAFRRWCGTIGLRRSGAHLQRR